MTFRKHLNSFAKHLVLLFFALIMITPFVWMVFTAFRSQAEAMSIDPFVFFPREWRTDAFEAVFRNFNFLRLYFNTFVLMALRALFAVLTATTAGYAFARLNFKGKNFAFGLVLFQMMIPAQIFIIPQFLMVTRMGMNNTMFALLFPGLVTAFGTFLLRQQFMSLPKDLEDSAKMDGCNIGQTFLYVMLPLARSSMVALAIFTSLFAFRELMWPMIVTTDPTRHTLTVALAFMQGQFGTNFPELMAASFLAIIPMLILFLFFQKHFIEGISRTGGK